MGTVIARLRGHGIRPTPQRVAVARCIFHSKTHPSAGQVLKKVRKLAPAVSRASVYNALELFVRKGLLEKRPLRNGRHIYDPIVKPHHHFIDERTGEIHDLPQESCQVSLAKALPGFNVRDFQVVLRGHRTD